MGGILIETQWRSGAISGAIIGVGINMQYEPGLPSACALNEFTEAHVSPLQLAHELARRLEERFGQLRAGLWNDIVVEYLENLWRLGVEQEALCFPLWRGTKGEDEQDKSPEYEVASLIPPSRGEVITGTIRGIDNTGNLLFETNGEVRSYGLKEISFVY
jgi:BirA family biotin operon repressor/biotin-[acetyl-CoA-carboxylase] ligase